MIVKFATGRESNSNNDSLLVSNTLATSNVNRTISSYLKSFQEQDAGQDLSKIEERKSSYQDLIKSYYNLSTDFYEYGWGESFHFAPRYKVESFPQSISRHEYYLSSRLGLKQGMKVLDCGCGVGGPMRSIAKFSGASITGVTICEYQVGRANQLNGKYGLQATCQAVQGNFMQLGRSEEFDCAYAIEATCHAPDRTLCFKQIFQALKPGGKFAVYDWAMTPLYDKNNALHRQIKHEIEKGDGLPDLQMESDIVNSMVEAGFTIVESKDVAKEYESKPHTIPWYFTLKGNMRHMANMRHTKWGRFLTHIFVWVMETLRIAPKGTTETHRMLCHAADFLVLGGELKIFTPMFFVLAQKPE